MHAVLTARLGGRGLRGQEELAPAAWAASWAQSLAGVRERTGPAELADLEVPTLPLAAACREALTGLRPGLADGAGPPPGSEERPLPPWRQLAHELQEKVQRRLTRRLDSNNTQPC